MESSFRNRFDLLWRIIGGNIIILLVGILKYKADTAIGANIIFLNVVMIIFMTAQVMMRKYTIQSSAKNVLIMYVVYKLGIIFGLVNSNISGMIEILTTCVELLWISEFYFSKILQECNSKK